MNWMWICLIILNFLLSFWIVFSQKKHSNEIKKLVDSNKKHMVDINSLHKNQGVISSSIKELHRMIKKYDKGAKKRIQIDTPQERP